MKKLWVILGFALLLGCSSQTIHTYESATPKLDLHQFFDGKIMGWGMFQKDSGEVQRRFTVTINATHEGNNVIVLDEQFAWADGTTSERIWRLTKQIDGTWRGRAGDVIGEATGEVSGNALHWKYVLSLPVGDKVYEVNFDDWMYLIDDNVMLNRSVMSKWGFDLGSVTLSLHKEPAK